MLIGRSATTYRVRVCMSNYSGVKSYSDRHSKRYSRWPSFQGTQYVEYDGALTLTRQWRKSEPLENAFMVMAFEAEPTW